MAEETYVSPIFRERKRQEELADVCKDILKNSRNELYLSMRFLDVSLSALHFTGDFSSTGFSTDGTTLYFEPAALVALYQKNRILVNRMYLHIIFHCLFCHIWRRNGRDKKLWDLASDIAVESIIDGFLKKSVHVPVSPYRRNIYDRLKANIPVLNADCIYDELSGTLTSEEEYERMKEEFFRDDHERWDDRQDQQKPRPNPRKNKEKDWDENREKMETEMEMFSDEASEDEKDLRDHLSVENRERYDYKEFLRKFSIRKEAMQIDPDSFDYVFYNYGMELYGNMPLIEPLETKEIRRVEDFVIVIDTSMSCSGELVRQFLEETYTVLSQSESFFKKVNIHIIQCDDRVRQDVKIEREDQLRAYMDHLELLGMGGTDFRPAFEYVDQLLHQNQFDKLKGLLYFTDGYGIFPVKMPPYETAFIFVRETGAEADVPPWAIRIILNKRDLDVRKEIKDGY